MHRYWFPKPYADQVARLRVSSGFVLVAMFAWLSRPNGVSMLIGMPISVLGLLLRGWAAGHLAKNLELAQSGPYAHTRNPLYLGTLLVAAGLVIAGRSILLAAIFITVFTFVYLPVIELEEQHLRNLFADYDSYAMRVPKLMGRRSGRPELARTFDPRLYWRNREYEALCGFAAGAAFLFWKCLAH